MTTFTSQLTGLFYSAETEVKSLLDQGTPVTVDLNFYYGTWNHRLADSLGIPRNLDHWDKGVVGYPYAGSVDYINTKQEPAGHSVLIVGYDRTRLKSSLTT